MVSMNQSLNKKLRYTKSVEYLTVQIFILLQIIIFLKVVSCNSMIYSRINLNWTDNRERLVIFFFLKITWIDVWISQIHYLELTEHSKSARSTHTSARYGWLRVIDFPTTVNNTNSITNLLSITHLTHKCENV